MAIALPIHLRSRQIALEPILINHDVAGRHVDVALAVPHHM